MPGGKLSERIRTNHNANLISLASPFLDASCPQLLGVVEGLGYLHSHNEIHGDLKGVRRSVYVPILMLTVIGTGEYIS